MISNIFVDIVGNFSEILTILGCGAAILWLNQCSKKPIYEILLATGSNLIDYGHRLMECLVQKQEETNNAYYKNSANVKYTRCEQSTLNNTSNHILVWNQFAAFTDTDDVEIVHDKGYREDEEEDDIFDCSFNEPESISLSPLDSIGTSTVARFDRLLEQVTEIKEGIAEDDEILADFNQKNCEPQLPSSSPSSYVFDRHCRQLSESELTLPSLEWDLNDLNLDEDETNNQSAGMSKTKLLYKLRPREFFLDNNFKSSKSALNIEILAQMLFDKNFHMQEERKLISRKHYAQLKHQLRFMALNYAQQQRQQQQENNNLNRNGSFNRTTMRDSAFFEDL